jgi:membrane-associated phospholipid phosphatase
MRRGLLVLALLLGGVSAGQGQPSAESVPFCREEARRQATVDTRGLGAVYCTANPVLTRPLQAAHASARPAFYGAVPLAWGAAALLRDDGDYTDAYRLTLTQGATYGLVLGLKHAVGRPRPYVRRALVSHSAHYSASQEADAYTSFPSGHAALSAALVTSWTLSHPKWYVGGPGAAWAVAVSLSRLHLGVHYPSDVLVGAGIGVGMAVLVHQMRERLTPEIVRGEPTGALRVPPPITVRVRF